LTYLRGEEGSAVELRLKREGASPFVVELKREKVLLNEDRLTYAVEPHGNGWIGKIVLPGFYDNGEGVSSEKDLREAIKELKAKGPLHGLVIDLRENSGGFLTQAVKVAGLFITKGIIVISKYSDGEIRYMRDIDGRLYYEGPLVLLTSKASASAAEIVAQALQDYGVAVIVGDERTYGKGSMQYQTVTEENPPAFYKVTVGRYYTISGRSTQIEGVKADIVVETIFSPYNIGERYLEYPISRDNLELEHLMSDKNSSKNFQKKYLPNLQVQETVWKKMLPKLKANSEQRLAKDPNYQLFLKRLKGEVKDSKKSSFGQEDLQLKEAVNIVKDMIQLSKGTQKKA
jgi:carboxyl-terminal processing protease